MTDSGYWLTLYASRRYESLREGGGRRLRSLTGLIAVLCPDSRVPVANHASRRVGTVQIIRPTNE